MDLIEFAQEYEEIERDMRVMYYTFGACYETITDGQSEENECVIWGLYDRIYELNKRMQQLAEKVYRKV